MALDFTKNEEFTKPKKQFSIEEVYRFNLIELAKHHRKFCEGENCNISLILLLEMAGKIGIHFTDKEKELFI